MSWLRDWWNKPRIDPEAALWLFKPGDVVRLKIGGPKMIVARVVCAAAMMHTGRPAGIHCDWIDRMDRPHRAVYSPVQLEFVEPSQVLKIVS